MSVIELKVKKGKFVATDPIVSVITPAYNVAEYISETLESAFTQTLNDIEIIVVNDGSPDSDRLESVLQPYLERIIYIVQTNQGAAIARNTAIRHASGKYLAFLDGDDVWHQDHLKTQIDFLVSNDLDMAYSDGELFGENIKAGQLYSEKSPSNGSVTPESLLNEKCNVLMCSVVAKKDSIVSAGMFDEVHERMPAEDFDLWFRLAKKGYTISFHNGVTTKYRVRTTGLTGNSVQNATRTIDILTLIKAKYELTKDEASFLERSLNNAYAYKAVELAKTNLVKKNFLEAKNELRLANSYFPRFKYDAFLFLLYTTPFLARILFILLWPEEAGAILNSDS